VDRQRLSETLEALTWMADRAADLPEESAKAMKMTLTLTTASLYVAEYLFHTGTAALEPYDALVKTACGEMSWPELGDLLQAIQPDLHDPLAPGDEAA